MSMTKPAHDALRVALENAVKEALPPVQRTCLACVHFDEPSEHCKRYSARPPARVIAYGCDAFVLDDVPW